MDKKTADLIRIQKKLIHLYIEIYDVDGENNLHVAELQNAINANSKAIASRIEWHLSVHH